MSQVILAITVAITAFCLWIFGETYAFHRHWKYRIFAKIFRTRLGQGLFAQFTSMFVGASVVFLLEYFYAPAEALTSSAFYPYEKSLISIILPATIFAGWEAGAPVTTSGMLVTTFFNIFFLVNGLARIGGALAFKVLGFIKRGNRMKGEPHYLIIGGKLNTLEIVLEQMTSSALDCRRKPVTVVLPTEQKDILDAFEDRYINKEIPVNFFEGNILSVEDLENSGIFDAVGIILLPTELEDSSPDSTVLFCAKAIDRLFTERGKKKPHIVAKINNQLYEDILDDYVDQIICSESRDFNLVAASVFNKGLSTIYDDLIRISDDTNEIYIVKVPNQLIGKPFSEISVRLCQTSKETNNPLIVMGIVRGKKSILNPPMNVIKDFEEKDKLVVMSSRCPDKQIREFASDVT